MRWTFKLYDASGDGVLEQPEVRACHRVTLAWKIPLEIKDFPKIKKNGHVNYLHVMVL